MYSIRTNEWSPTLTFRKRCDESYPLCGFCELRSVPCVWPEKMHERHNSKVPSTVENMKMTNVGHKTKRAGSRPADGRINAVDSAKFHQKRAHKVQADANVNEGMGGAEMDKSRFDIPELLNLDGGLSLKGPSAISVDTNLGAEVIPQIDNREIDTTNVAAQLEDPGIDPTKTQQTQPFDSELQEPQATTSGASSSLQIISTQCDDFLPISLDLISSFGDFGYPFRLSPGFLFTSNLDSEGTLYLEYYREQYCSFVSIAPMTLNYFLKTFFSLATRKRSILYALTAWGGFYLELKKPEPDYSKPWLYMQKAAKLMCDEIGSVLEPSTDDEFFTLLALYLIFVGIEVCTGDVENWFQFHQRCSQLLLSGGGPARVAQRFDYSNDIKFLLSDFQYHDLLLSNALTGGTHFSLSEYDRVLCDGDKNYGIDPLQGTIAPIYSIICEIANAKVEVQKLVEAMDRLEAQGEEAYEERTKYYDQLVQLWSELDRKIDNCRPWKSHMRMLARDQNQLSLHMALFELYTYICRIQLNASILSLAPSATTQQRWLLKALVLVDLLIDSPLNVSLLLSLVVCGVTCWRAYDRERMRERFQIHQHLYLLGNLKRVQEIVEEIWLANPTGDVCIDWPDFAKDHGWSLWVG